MQGYSANTSGGDGRGTPPAKQRLLMVEIRGAIGSAPFRTLRLPPQRAGRDPDASANMGGDGRRPGWVQSLPGRRVVQGLGFRV